MIDLPTDKLMVRYHLVLRDEVLVFITCVVSQHSNSTKHYGPSGTQTNYSSLRVRRLNHWRTRALTLSNLLISNNK